MDRFVALLESGPRATRRFSFLFIFFSSYLLDEANEKTFVTTTMEKITYYLDIIKHSPKIGRTRAILSCSLSLSFYIYIYSLILLILQIHSLFLLSLFLSSHLHTIALARILVSLSIATDNARNRKYVVPS